ncbi:MAG: phage holin family protein [Solirubrobacterales bacterium]
MTFYPREGGPGVKRYAGFAIRVAILGLIQAAALYGMSAIIPGVDVPSFKAGIAVVVLLALFNALLWPFITRLILPLTVLTFGIIGLLATTLAIWLILDLVDKSQPTLFGAFLAAIVMSLVTTIGGTLLDVDGDAYHLRIVRRRLGRERRQNSTEVPGTIFFEIDGLAEPLLREAIAAGHVPTIERWLTDGSHRLMGWECDLSSQTGASQSGLLLGSNENMPAFRWYEKDTGRLMVSNSIGDAAEIERRHATGTGLLAVEGTSRGNLVSGDAPRASATMSVVKDRSRSRSAEFYAYFADWAGLIRTLTLCFHDIFLEKVAYWRQKRSGAEHVNRGGIYPLLRCTITVIMRDLNSAILLADIVEGVPVSYATYVGYDEVAHHSGIREPDAFAALKRLDRQLLRLERACAQAPRPYNIVVLSDHGQTQGRPFRQRCGQTLEEVVEAACSGEVSAPVAVEESWGVLGAWLADLGSDEGPAGRFVKRATRDRMADDTVALGPNRELLEQKAGLSGEEDEERPETIVLASGCLGLVSFPRVPGRMTAEQIEELHPGLLATLAGHPDIGWVMVSSEADGAVVLGAEGSHRLSDDHVEGVDPLTGYGEHAADHLRRTDGFEHCPDILVNGAYDPQTGEVAPFEEFMGSHGGLGGTQMSPFALVPSQWSDPQGPIVGAASMHHQLKDWMAESGLEIAASDRRLTTAGG